MRSEAGLIHGAARKSVTQRLASAAKVRNAHPPVCLPAMGQKRGEGGAEWQGKVSGHFFLAPGPGAGKFGIIMESHGGIRPVSRGEFLRSGLWALGAMALPGLARGQSAADIPPVPVDPRLAIPLPGESAEGLSQYPQPLPKPVAASAPFVHHGARETMRIAVTFDDGPTPGVTEKVLAALERHRAKATFFQIGRCVEARPALARAVRAAGHEVANHSFTHPALGPLPASRVEIELKKTQATIEDTVGVTPTWFRPPYGSFRPAQGPLARAQALDVVIWSVDPRDWARPGVSAIQQRVFSQTQGGDIVLCHDLHAQTGEAADGLIGGLVDRGFELVTLSELLG